MPPQEESLSRRDLQIQAEAQQQEWAVRSNVLDLLRADIASSYLDINGQEFSRHTSRYPNRTDPGVHETIRSIPLHIAINAGVSPVGRLVHQSAGPSHALFGLVVAYDNLNAWINIYLGQNRWQLALVDVVRPVETEVPTSTQPQAAPPLEYLITTDAMARVTYMRAVQQLRTLIIDRNDEDQVYGILVRLGPALHEYQLVSHPAHLSSYRFSLNEFAHFREQNQIIFGRVVRMLINDYQHEITVQEITANGASEQRYDVRRERPAAGTPGTFTPPQPENLTSTAHATLPSGERLEFTYPSADEQQAARSMQHLAVEGMISSRTLREQLTRVMQDLHIPTEWMQPLQSTPRTDPNPVAEMGDVSTEVLPITNCVRAEFMMRWLIGLRSERDLDSDPSENPNQHTYVASYTDEGGTTQTLRSRPARIASNGEMCHLHLSHGELLIGSIVRFYPYLNRLTIEFDVVVPGGRQRRQLDVDIPEMHWPADVVDLGDLTPIEIDSASLTPSRLDDEHTMSEAEYNARGYNRPASRFPNIPAFPTVECVPGSLLYSVLGFFYRVWSTGPEVGVQSRYRYSVNFRDEEGVMRVIESVPLWTAQPGQLVHFAGASDPIGFGVLEQVNATGRFATVNEIVQQNPLDYEGWTWHQRFVRVVRPDSAITAPMVTRSLGTYEYDTLPSPEVHAAAVLLLSWLQRTGQTLGLSATNIELIVNRGSRVQHSQPTPARERRLLV
jgi:hypothetical protein